jgi:hypothetical protein
MSNLAVTILANALEVAPGASATFAVEVRNLGTVVDRYRCEVVGLDPSWWTVKPASVELFPVREGEDGRRSADVPPTVGRFSVTVHPPRSSAALARAWPVGAKVTSEHDPANRLVEETTIDVLPFGALEAAMRPKVLSGRFGASTMIHLTNLGNRPEEVAIVASDAAERLDFQIDKTVLTIRPGESAKIPMRVSGGAPGLVGGRDTRPFTVDIKAASFDTAASSLRGSFEKHPLVPAGLPVAIAALAALSMGGVGVWAVVGLASQSTPLAPSTPPSIGPVSTPTPAATPAPTLGPTPTPESTTAPPPTAPPPTAPPPTAPPTAPPPTATPISDRFAIDDELFPGGTRMSANRLYLLTLQGDGNLVLTRTDRTGAEAVIWAPLKFRPDLPAGYGYMQSDGNFVLYQQKPAALPAVWATGTHEYPGATLLLQNDGNMVVRVGAGPVLWASKSDPGCQRECAP